MEIADVGKPVVCTVKEPAVPVTKVAALALVLPGRTRFVWGYLAAALLALSQWVLAPVMDAAHRHGAVAGLPFGAWHGVAAAVYGLACLAMLRVIWNEDFR